MLDWRSYRIGVATTPAAVEMNYHYCTTLNNRYINIDVPRGRLLLDEMIHIANIVVHVY